MSFNDSNLNHSNVKHHSHPVVPVATAQPHTLQRISPVTACAANQSSYKII